jgi:hypothetical protein
MALNATRFAEKSVTARMRQFSTEEQIRVSGQKRRMRTVTNFSLVSQFLLRLTPSYRHNLRALLPVQSCLVKDNYSIPKSIFSVFVCIERS